MRNINGECQRIDADNRRFIPDIAFRRETDSHIVVESRRACRVLIGKGVLHAVSVIGSGDSNGSVIEGTVIVDILILEIYHTVPRRSWIKDRIIENNFESLIGKTAIGIPYVIPFDYEFVIDFIIICENLAVCASAGNHSEVIPEGSYTRRSDLRAGDFPVAEIAHVCMPK